MKLEKNKVEKALTLRAHDEARQRALEDARQIALEESHRKALEESRKKAIEDSRQERIGRRQNSYSRDPRSVSANIFFNMLSTFWVLMQNSLLNIFVLFNIKLLI